MRAQGGDSLRILYISARYPPFVGGTEIHTAEVARRMVDRGHDVTVLTTAFEPIPTGEQVVEGVPVVKVRAWPADFDLYIAPALSRFIKHGSWDIVHCQGYHTFVAPMAMAAAIRARQRFVVTFHSGGHSSMLRRSLRPLQQQLLRPMLKRAERLIGVSQFETDFFRRRLHLPANQFATITNGVSPDFLEVSDDNDTSRRVICSVGRLERYKGHHRVIETLPALRKLVPNVVLYIVGDGPYRTQLQTLVRRLDVADIVEFLSVDPGERRQMAELFRSAHLIALLSDYESQGVVGLEAIAVGRPLLVADGTALAELGKYGAVSVVPPNVDKYSLAEVIARKLQEDVSPPRHLVPLWENTADQLETLYRELVD
ncbi:MAG TPA: glycosyltransferase family 4 protein [Ilumatobacteraceae bacterium]|nr:glycosyltransferase family 4 protein [Ilumatobacteraceae bacterium]